MFTVVSLVTIGLAVGANAAIFSVINGVLLKPLPYAEPERLVSVRQSSPALNLLDMELSPADYFTFRDENRTFEEFGLWSGGSVSITGLAAPEQVRSLTVTDRTLAAIGAQPSMGRWFTAKDDSGGSPQTAILTHGYWDDQTKIEKLAMANPDSVPAGKYGKAALEKLGAWPAVEKQVARADNVRAALALVSRGEAPFGIVYSTDALSDKGVRIVDTFPAGSYPPIVYPAALIATSKSAAGKPFLDFLRGTAARATWEKYGFGLAQ